MAANELPEMPNGPIMELHGQRKRFHVPYGMKPLLEELTREVLRYQPDDIYTFLWQYTEMRLEKRAEEEATKKSEKMERWNSLDGPDLLDPEELGKMLNAIGISKETADIYATKIQSAFRGHRIRRSLDEKRKSLQGGGGPRKDRRSFEAGGKILTEDELKEYLKEVNSQLELGQANKMVTKIQALYRGHAARRSLKQRGLLRKSIEEEEEEAKREETDPDEEEEEEVEVVTPKEGEKKEEAHPDKKVARPEAAAVKVAPEEKVEAAAALPAEKVETIKSENSDAPPEKVQVEEEEATAEEEVTKAEEEGAKSEVIEEEAAEEATFAATAAPAEKAPPSPPQPKREGKKSLPPEEHMGF